MNIMNIIIERGHFYDERVYWLCVSSKIQNKSNSRIKLYNLIIFLKRRLLFDNMFEQIKFDLEDIFDSTSFLLHVPQNKNLLKAIRKGSIN